MISKTINREKKKSYNQQDGWPSDSTENVMEKKNVIPKSRLWWLLSLDNLLYQLLVFELIFAASPRQCYQYQIQSIMSFPNGGGSVRRRYTIIASLEVINKVTYSQINASVKITIADHQTKHRLLLNLSTSSELILDFSGRSAALDFTTRLSKLFLEASGRWAASCVRGLSEGIISIMSLLLLWAPSFTVGSFEPFFAACLATDEMNFLRWRM